MGRSISILLTKLFPTSLQKFKAAEKEEGCCFFVVLFLWLAISYTKYCNSWHGSVMMEVGRAHRGNLRLGES